MARVAGIKIEKDAKGNPRYARFDLRKHREVIEPYLTSIGAIDDYDLSDCMTLEEAREGSINFINNLYDRKENNSKK